MVNIIFIFIHSSVYLNLYSFLIHNFSIETVWIRITEDISTDSLNDQCSGIVCSCLCVCFFSSKNYSSSLALLFVVIGVTGIVQYNTILVTKKIFQCLSAIIEIILQKKIPTCQKFRFLEDFDILLLWSTSAFFLKYITLPWLFFSLIDCRIFESSSVSFEFYSFY